MSQDRPVGAIVENWTPPPAPGALRLDGRYGELVPLSAADHAAPLWEAFQGHDWLWDYMFAGPFDSFEGFRDWIASCEAGSDPLFLAIRDKETGQWGGMASYLRIAPEAGSIEVGNINFAPCLQRTRAATEAMALMMGWAFEAGYRRYEWKCNALNAPSRRAAQRYGFSYEGIFRQALVVKGRNRDTAWLAVIDSEWPELKAGFEAWLDPSNFDGEGRQKRSLSDWTAPVLKMIDPSL
ncbi:GNAT family N-acetyltransferase [Pseudooceanicola sp. 216_PA32_1]|uniref:GNAT family N-acetyltransferase n=1 Tax=Pseudooceanicola pacificus TaxID=2676438 RepID=A0A844WAX3_9RHOB|nr:GNAT family protein [Pseudooceanicola pacificus]MWB77868.1 GNAT family N-acetyltransferase [Pseudooceanicola pacificus]